MQHKFEDNSVGIVKPNFVNIEQSLEIASKNIR